MDQNIFKYQFGASVNMVEVEASLVLAIISTESLHGESQVRLDASHAMDIEQRSCVIDARTLVGQDLNRLFIGYIRREFGEDAFRVERIRPEAEPNRRPAEPVPA